MIKTFDGQMVEIYGDMWTTSINKPLYGTYCNLNEKLLNAAIQANATLIVKCPNAELTISAKEWKETSLRTEKVFKRPDEPMILYGRSLKEYDPFAKKEKPQQELF